MAKDPADRFPSAAEMADALSGVRAKLSGPAYPETLSLRHSVEMAIQQKTKADTARRSRKMAIGGGALAAAALLALVWSQIGSPRPPGEPASVPAPATAVAPAPVVARTDTTTSTSSGSSDLRGAAKAGSRAAPQTAAATPAVQRPAPPAPRTRVPAPEVRPSPAESRAVTPRTVAPAAIPSTSVVTLPPVPQPAVRTELATPRPAPIGPVQAATERAPPPAAAPAAATTAADLAPIFESYARAIESRDVGSIRRVYPGLTPEQERGFEQFFRSARDINVTFRASNVEIDGATAEARLTGHYQYVAANGKSERQPVSFMANLRREGGDWRMVSVR
jgi:hypothetical protein